ncbi:MAG: alpha/beta hydrolase, partial [Acidobacteria bacterium]|nr:alpha/beta hydrolase [Acidobacteriota bacterium]
MDGGFGMRHAVTVVVGLLLVGVALVGPVAAQPGGDLFDRVEHGFADSDGVRIHYVSIGDGPLVIMIHGFPDFWYTWRGQMDAIAETHRVVAM